MMRDEDFLTAVFADLDPRGWLQLVICGHPPPLRLGADGDVQVPAPLPTRRRWVCILAFKPPLLR
jgi:hypothetical protein